MKNILFFYWKCCPAAGSFHPWKWILQLNKGWRGRNQLPDLTGRRPDTVFFVWTWKTQLEEFWWSAFEPSGKAPGKPSVLDLTAESLKIIVQNFSNKPSRRGRMMTAKVKNASNKSGWSSHTFQMFYFIQRGEREHFNTNFCCNGYYYLTECNVNIPRNRPALIEVCYLEEILTFIDNFSGKTNLVISGDGLEFSRLFSEIFQPGQQTGSWQNHQIFQQFYL